MNLDEKLKRYKEELKEKRDGYNIAKGALGHLLSAIQNDYGVKNEKGLEDKIAEMKKKRDEIDKNLKKGLEEVNALFGGTTRNS